MPSESSYEIDDSKSILEKIARMYADRLMSDIVLVVGNQEFPAHRLILCASSDVFQVMLMNPEWTESHERRILLQEAPECIEVFEMFLWYLYTGQLKISHSIVLPILVLADKYNITDLVRICGDYMIGHRASAGMESYLFSWLQYTMTCGHTSITESLMNHLKWNFEQVSSSRDFVSCDINLLSIVLSQHDLIVYDEMKLYNSVVRWLQHQEQALDSMTQESKQPHSITLGQPSINPPCRKYCFRRDESNSISYEPSDQMECLTYEVMRYVRFPMMTPRQLAELLLVDLIIKYKEFFVTRMAIGMSFHSGQWDRIKEVFRDSDPANQLLFTPRLYTVEKWSAGLAIDNLPQLPAYHTRTLVFSTPVSASDFDNKDSQVEWIVELYPKGVWFKKFFLIIWQGNIEVPDVVLKTCRVSITAKDVDFVRVRVTVLIYGVREGIQHVIRIFSMRHIFTSMDNLLNMDDIIPFAELNDPLEGKKYLLDPCNSLKIRVVINPLVDQKFGGIPHSF